MTFPGSLRIALLIAVTWGLVPHEPLRPSDRAAIIEQAFDRLERRYVYPGVAAKMVAAIREKQRAGAYDALDDRQTFASVLTNDLREVSHDRHLRIGDSRVTQPTAGGDAVRRSAGLTFETLDGEIGYLRLHEFPSVERLSPPLDRAMQALTPTKAMIIDLRGNQGGSPAGVMYLVGYLLPKRTLVARIYSRPQNSTTEMWTEETPEPKYLDRPVYVLTNASTFSAAEAAAYHLKHLGRGRTVGERTGGGAHRVESVELPHGFTMRLPIARPISVITNGDWERTGVEPDIATDDAGALAAAHVDAVRTLPPSEERTVLLERLRQRYGIKR